VCIRRPRSEPIFFTRASTKTGGSVVHGYNKTIDWKVVGLLALGSVPMTLLSILALYYLGVDSKAVQGIITKTLGFALFFTAFSLFLRKPLMKWYDAKIGEPDPKLVARLTVLTGAVLGVLVTLSSVGAGAIGVMALVMLYPKMPAQRIVGSDIAHAVPLTLAGQVSVIRCWARSIGTFSSSLLCGSLPAIVIASVASARTSDTVVRVALGVVLLAVVARFWFL